RCVRCPPARARRSSRAAGRAAWRWSRTPGRRRCGACVWARASLRLRWGGSCPDESVDLARSARAEKRALQLVLLGVDGRVERARRDALPHHVRRDAGTDDRRPELRPGRGASAVRVEAVTERALRSVREEAVRATPAPAEPGVERVDVQVASVAVE